MLPSESDADIDSIPNILKETLPEGLKLLAHKKEPIAFGLYSLLADFTLDDSEGQMESAVIYSSYVYEELINLHYSIVKIDNSKENQMQVK